MGTPTGRAVIAAAVLGSGMALLDGTVVNVALRTIGEDLDATLAAAAVDHQRLPALAGQPDPARRLARRPVRPAPDLRDRHGLVRAASLLCGLAPTAEVLIAARILQGVGGALLTPGSLAMIQGAFVPRGPGAGDRRLVRPRRDRRRDRPVRRRRPGRVRQLALDLPDQPAARRGHRPDRAALGARDPRPARARPLRLRRRGARRARARRHDVRADRVGRPARARGPPWSRLLAAVGVRRRRAARATQPDAAARSSSATAPSAPPTR